MPTEVAQRYIDVRHFAVQRLALLAYFAIASALDATFEDCGAQMFEEK